MRDRRFTTVASAFLAGALVAGLVPLSALADPAGGGPPVPNPFPTPPPTVFCFRITDVEQDPVDSDRFTFELEFLNWTDKPASGAYIWTNIGTRVTEGALPTLVDAGVDIDGRGGPRGGNHIGTGIYNIPAHQSGRGRGDIPFHLNDWTVVFRGPTSIYWGDAGMGNTPIPQRSLLTQGSSAAQYALVPGLGNDGLLKPDSAIDGGPLPYGPPTQPAPFPAGGRPTPDGSGNVLDGFTITVDDFDEGEVLSMNWILTDPNGESIGKVGNQGNVVGNAMGFGLFNLVRVPVGGTLPDGVFIGNSGFVRGTNFYQDVYDIPATSTLGAPIVASFGVEFGPALLAPPLNPNPGNEVPPIITTPIPDVSPVVTPSNTDIAPCSYEGRGDANGSGVVNITDVQCMLLLSGWELTGSVGSPPACWAGDWQAVELNCDDTVNVADVQIVISYVLAKPLPFEIDTNGNQCPDSCDCSFTYCNDGNACTIDMCSDKGGCLNLPFACDDGDPCTTDGCSQQSGCVFAPVDCAGSLECPVAEGTACDDGNPCTEGDACQAGTCLGTPASCDDGNPCTMDTCLAAGCTHVPLPNGALCAGLNQCIGGLCTTPMGCTSNAQCNAAADACTTYACQPVPGMLGENKCVIVSMLECNDGNACTDDMCDGAIGCVNMPNDDNPCNDGDDCNQMDVCLDGQCLGLGEVCDDGNPCSVDFCAPDTACYGTPLHGPLCDDGNACIENESCKIGHCLGDPVDCDDDNVCTIDSCNPDTGCEYADVECVDGDVCTDDGCDPEFGCQYVLNTAPCNDGSVCTTADTCAAGACLGVVVPCTGDGVACTVEACHAITGCFSTPSNVLCNDGVACTVDACHATLGCSNTANDAACSDGISCTLDSCDEVAGCLHEQDDAVCEDGNPCTDNACGLISGCIAAPNSAACDDGNPLTAGDFCANGQCQPGTFVGAFDTYWDVTQGDGEAEWFDVFTKTFDTLLVNDPMLFTIQYAEFNEKTPPDGDVVSFVLDVPPGAQDFDLTYLVEGISLEDSGAWLFWEDSMGAFHNVQCDDTGVSDGTPPLTSAEAAQVPYVCGVNSLFFAWNNTVPYPTGFTPVKLHFRVLLTKGTGIGDLVRVYKLGLVNVTF